jgi:hypothetical protein
VWKHNTVKNVSIIFEGTLKKNYACWKMVVAGKFLNVSAL